MHKWPYPVVSCQTDLVQRYCVYNNEWQLFRETMRGQPTKVKLDMLEQWQNRNRERHETNIQVSNYINALKRSGQLNMNLEVVR